MRKFTRDCRAFSLVEIILSVAAIAILAGIGVPVYHSFETRNELDIAATMMAQSARRAEMLSQAMDGSVSWGIQVTTTSLTIFQGTSYAGRATSVDEVYPLALSAVSGTVEYVFSKLTGFPVASGSTALISPSDETRIISINAKGTVTY
ncbi:MAG: prepilin-type N-terminal cleavage/methylation domain-containing protein [Patescibacteria group bacterium]